MVTSPNELKILEWNEKLQTNKQFFRSISGLNVSPNIFELKHENLQTDDSEFHFYTSY